ncbi:MAG TPA: hypothetical protein EYN91_01130 [Candidatus Melainabacteria bacterium]|nr:hypothetical protein [Candidatus Melainabacteria bacterium]HIN65689.1 hypothetical protein [Candidatus Obscuribacterales bacterium]
MDKKKAKKRTENPVYTQQDDSELLEATGNNPPDADPAQASNQTGNEGKADSHLPNVHKDAADKISKKDKQTDGESEKPDERDEDRQE